MSVEYCSRPGTAGMPYERFNRCGAGALTNAELIAILLRTGSKEEPVLQLAEHILQLRDNPTESLSVLYDVTKEELMELPGIGEVKAVRLLAACEFSKRLSSEEMLRGSASLVCDDPAVVAGYYMETMRHERQERVMILLLDSRLGLIRAETLTIGTVNAALCSPRDVFMRALQASAANVIVMHNHPSGDPTPSVQDIDLTGRLARAGKLLEVGLVDHLIIGDLCYTSMRQAGYLE